MQEHLSHGGLGGHLTSSNIELERLMEQSRRSEIGVALCAPLHKFVLGNLILQMLVSLVLLRDCRDSKGVCAAVGSVWWIVIACLDFEVLGQAEYLLH